MTIEMIVVAARGRSLVARARTRRVVDALSGTALLAVAVGVAGG